MISANKDAQLRCSRWAAASSEGTAKEWKWHSHRDMNEAAPSRSLSESLRARAEEPFRAESRRATTNGRVSGRARERRSHRRDRDRALRGKRRAAQVQRSAITSLTCGPRDKGSLDADIA